MDLFTQKMKAKPKFDGSDIEDKFDTSRLSKQIRELYDLIRDGRYRTLSEIKAETGHPESSISANLRNLRKKRFGSFTVNKRRRNLPSAGLWEYQLIDKIA